MTTCFVLAILVIGVVTFGFLAGGAETYRDKNVQAGEIESPISAFSVHSSKTQYLIVNGKTYKGIRGLKPYYLDIPKLNSILFVTEGSKYRVTFHLVNLELKREISIDGGTSGFGSSIGSGTKPGEQFSDYIENVQSNKVTIATRSLSWKETSLLNLDSKRIERQETFLYDASGKVTNHWASVNGERVK